MSLGPQCLTCKKRRVKCDSDEPKCQKCAKDGYNCPGYTKSLQWVVVKPAAKKPRRLKKNEGCAPYVDKPSVAIDTSPASSSSSPSSRASSGTVSLSSESEGWVAVRTRFHRSPFWFNPITDSDKKSLKAIDVANFFNEQVNPDLSAIYWKGKPPIPIKEWLCVPDLLRNTINVSCLAVKSLRFGCKVNKELYECRGIVLRDLATYLGSPAQQSALMSLWFITSILAQEVYLSPIHDFRVHLDAAHRMIFSFGGFEECLRKFPDCKEMLFFYILTDVMCTTTSPTASLHEAQVTAQPEYPYYFKHFEDCLLDSCFPCPVTLFESITTINSFRASRVRPVDAWKLRFLELLEDLQSFNPWKWANSLDAIPDDLDALQRTEAINEWATLASCIQSATTIYLVESTRPSLKAADLNELATALLVEAREQLLQDLRFLFSYYPLRVASPDKPLLWRFICWPIIVYMYATVAMGITAPEENVILGAERSKEATVFQEMRQVGVSLASHTLLGCANLFEEMAQSKKPVVWDGAFWQSCVFVL